MMQQRKGIIGISLVVVFLVGTALGGGPIPPKGVKLENFDYRGVTLDGGRVREHLDETCDEYLRIPNDDLLIGYRKRAGLPAPGRELGGWYTDDVYNPFGQYISGLSRLYAVTGNAACREKANTLVAEWAKCIAPDGYFLCTAKGGVRHYNYDKMMWGLLDNYLYCGNKESLAHLSRITDWALKNLDKKHHWWNGEWYTLSENLYRAYMVTGDTKYRDFAAVWHYPEYWDYFTRKVDPFVDRPKGEHYHAYSHVNTFSGLGAAYFATGEARYLTTLVNAYDYLQANQVFATGGYGPNEMLVPRDRLLTALAETTNTFETQCGTWAVFKMVKYLLRSTADARFGDWAERLAINGVGATIHMSADGQVMYYSNYNPSGANKSNNQGGWSCCTGTRPQAVADFTDLIYFKDVDNLYVNLFAPSTVHWTHQGAKVTLRQTTRFPENGTLEFAVSSDRPTEFGLKIRIPQWLAGPMTAKLNGQPVTLEMGNDHWATLRRKWTTGDRLQIDLPMRLWASRFVPDRPYPAAILYGPVVLAARGTSADLFVKKIDLEHLDRDLIPVAGDVLTWRLARQPDVLLRPFYAYKEGEKYCLYLDPVAPWSAPESMLKFQPAWGKLGAMHITDAPDATVECTFEGTGIQWRGVKSDNCGKAEVTIDGKVVAVVDQYNEKFTGFGWSSEKLTPGKHTLRIRVLKAKSEKSKGYNVIISGADIVPLN